MGGGVGEKQIMYSAVLRNVYDDSDTTPRRPKDGLNNS
jgi:hypothetical protein